jgi:hypothetical protein
MFSHVFSLGRRARDAVLVVVVVLASGVFEVAKADIEQSVTLTVVRRLESGSQPFERVFSRQELMSMERHEIRTGTPWTDGTSTFEGVLLSEVLSRAGVRDATDLVMSALNDYTMVVPASDAQRYNVLVAFRMDGKDLEVRDKGPFWIIYPRDSFSELQDERFDLRWVWQLNRIEIR